MNASTFILLCLISLVFTVPRGYCKVTEERDTGDDDEKWELCSIERHPFAGCSVMAPRNAEAISQDVSTSPWKVYTWKPKIQQYFTHPITLGSDSGELLFANYIIVARSVDTGQILGHFEFQWDAIPACCYFKGNDYSTEGERLHPNMLYGSSARIKTKPNQTVLWTSPKRFTGRIVFMATFITSSQVYWPNVTSSEVEVIKRNHTRYPFSPILEEPGSLIGDVTEASDADDQSVKQDYDMG